MWINVPIDLYQNNIKLFQGGCIKTGKKFVQFTDSHMLAKSSQISALAEQVFIETEKLIEEQLIKQFKKTMPRVSYILGEIANLDIALSFVVYSKNTQVETCIPELLSS